MCLSTMIKYKKWMLTLQLHTVYLYSTAKIDTLQKEIGCKRVNLMYTLYKGTLLINAS